MKLIDSSVEILKQSEGIDGVYKQIELAGRTCYKSEENITLDSAKGFVDRMIKSKHGAMLEHGTVYLVIKTPKDSSYHGHEERYFRNKYSNVSEDIIDNEHIYYITTNFRVIVENGWLDDLQYLCEPTKYHEKRITVRFTCDRGISHEFVRHRVFSFAQESTRYCNYSKDKFNNELMFIIPSWWNIIDTEIKEKFIDDLECSEKEYLSLLGLGLKPQQARQILPNALKTELVMTGTISQWKEFFKLRCDKAAHPDAQYLANELLKQLYEQYPNELKIE
jgi:Predicted alternative thymidylate synthase